MISSNVSPEPYDLTHAASVDATVEVASKAPPTPIRPEFDHDFDKMNKTNATMQREKKFADPRNITALYMGQSTLATQSMLQTNQFQSLDSRHKKSASTVSSLLPALNQKKDKGELAKIAQDARHSIGMSPRRNRSSISNMNIARQAIALEKHQAAIVQARIAKLTRQQEAAQRRIAVDQR